MGKKVEREKVMSGRFWPIALLFAQAQSK